MKTAKRRPVAATTPLMGLDPGTDARLLNADAAAARLGVRKATL